MRFLGIITELFLTIASCNCFMSIIFNSAITLENRSVLFCKDSCKPHRINIVDLLSNNAAHAFQIKAFMLLLSVNQNTFALKCYNTFINTPGDLFSFKKNFCFVRFKFTIWFNRTLNAVDGNTRLYNTTQTGVIEL